MPYIYKYLVHNEIIYIGQAKNEERLISRIHAHASGTGLDKKFLPYLYKVKIYVHKCSTKKEMDSLETLFIDCYKPILNVQGVTEFEASFCPDKMVEWTPYRESDFAAVAESSEASVQEKRRKRRITKLQKNIYDIEQTIKVVQEAYYLIKDIPNIELLKQIEVNDEETMENLCDASYRQVTDNGGLLIASLGFRERNKDLGFTNIFVFSEYKQQLVNNYLSDMERYRKTIADCKTELEALTS